VTFLDVSASVVGKPVRPHIEEYVRDPHGLLRNRLLDRFDPAAALPAHSVYSGVYRGPWQLWFNPRTADRAIYLIGPNVVERWPRAKHLILCG
jgi:hypothetical protein